jgi:2-haloacid dehalogenase
MKATRRHFLIGSAVAPFVAAQKGGRPVAEVKALVYDIFGTIVDWRSSLIAEGAAWGQRKGLKVNWTSFADRWRSGYQPAMARVRKGEIPWTNLDALHRMIFDGLLEEFHIQGLTEQEKVEWCRAWWRLRPWPDSVAGLTRLKKKFLLAPLSNGNIALMTHLARHAGLPWDAILGAELVRHYKPDPEVYQSAPVFLGLAPEEIMMVAAHVVDLNAARKCGLRTGFIQRPDEFGGGPVGVPDKAQPGDFDVVCQDANDLARQMGA